MEFMILGDSYYLVPGADGRLDTRSCCHVIHTNQGGVVDDAAIIRSGVKYLVRYTI